MIWIRFTCADGSSFEGVYSAGQLRINAVVSTLVAEAKILVAGGVWCDVVSAEILSYQPRRV